MSAVGGGHGPTDGQAVGVGVAAQGSCCGAPAAAAHRRVPQAQERLLHRREGLRRRRQLLHSFLVRHEARRGDALCSAVIITLLLCYLEDRINSGANGP